MRSALLADAIASAASALPMIGLPHTLGGLLNLPAPLVFWAGVALLPGIALVAILARREHVPVVDVWLVIAGNAAWALGCVWLAFAELQFVGLRRAPLTTP